ncbi:MAG: hypothetical protein U5R06_21300 [candidate division KSB1 bacterium]|nr:hypothetical protein [candidate division KSB1 bacterium]
MNMFRESQADQYLNNVLWQNDPDVIFLRDYDTPFNETERRSIALWAGILGGTLTTSDRFSMLDAEAVELWRFLVPERRATAELPFWSTDREHPVAVRPFDNSNAWAILIVNTTDAVFEKIYDLQQLIGRKSAYCFEWNVGHCKPLGQRSNLSVTLAAHASVLYAAQTDSRSLPEDLRLGD